MNRGLHENDHCMLRHFVLDPGLAKRKKKKSNPIYWRSKETFKRGVHLSSSGPSPPGERSPEVDHEIIQRRTVSLKVVCRITPGLNANACKRELQKAIIAKAKLVLFLRAPIRGDSCSSSTPKR